MADDVLSPIEMNAAGTVTLAGSASLGGVEKLVGSGQTLTTFQSAWTDALSTNNSGDVVTYTLVAGEGQGSTNTYVGDISLTGTISVPKSFIFRGDPAAGFDGTAGNGITLELNNQTTGVRGITFNGTTDSFTFRDMNITFNTNNVNASMPIARTTLTNYNYWVNIIFHGRIYNESNASGIIARGVAGRTICHNVIFQDCTWHPKGNSDQRFCGVIQQTSGSPNRRIYAYNCAVHNFVMDLDNVDYLGLTDNAKLSLFESARADSGIFTNCIAGDGSIIGGASPTVNQYEGLHTVLTSFTTVADADATLEAATTIWSDPASGDFTLKTGSNTIGGGTDMSSGTHPFAEYLDGSARSAPWDVGPLPVGGAAAVAQIQINSAGKAVYGVG